MLYIMKELSYDGTLYFDKMFSPPSPNSPQANSLEEILALSTSLIEYTINLPSRFKDNRRLKYIDIIKYLTEKYKDVFTGVHPYYFEECKNGSVHVHGVFEIKQDIKVYIHGIVQDVARDILQRVDKRLKLDICKNYYIRFARYKSPLCCVQHTDDIERAKFWNEYITKSQ